jgi:uncharacterized protein YbjT (DUF2867 family)
VNSVFITGGSGYVGRPLITALVERGHRVHALVRPGSASKLPAGTTPIVGNALDASTFASTIPPASTIVHLVGTPHPNPSKAAEFERVDLASIRATTTVAPRADVRHIVYVSVAHPAPIMHDYIAVRSEGERLVTATGIAATILRPWYVLGPGHYWPYALVPMYAALRRIPSKRETAERLGLVTRAQMVAALVNAVENPSTSGVRIVEVPEIRRALSASSPARAT